MHVCVQNCVFQYFFLQKEYQCIIGSYENVTGFFSPYVTTLDLQPYHPNLDHQYCSSEPEPCNTRYSQTDIKKHEEHQ